jgi:hypothetical protein
MPLCACGCGEQTAGGEFRPGHDQSYRIATAGIVGGDRPLRELAEAAREYARGRLSLSDFSDRVRAVFAG